MSPRSVVILVVLGLAATGAAAVASAGGSFEGRRCTPPAGHRIADCRRAKHGTPDLSRAAWRVLRGAGVTFSERIDDLVANPAAGGARDWPLLDSLGQPLGRMISPRRHARGKRATASPAVIPTATAR